MKKRNLAKIATTIRKKRNSMGMTQEQAAEFVGISYSYYTKIENTIQAPALDTLVKICEAYHISLDGLLLDWNGSDRVTPEQKEFLFDLQNMEADRIKSCRDILDKLLMISGENSGYGL